MGINFFTPPYHNNDIVTDLSSLQAALSSSPFMDMCFTFPGIVLIAPFLAIYFAFSVLLKTTSMALARYVFFLLLIGYVFLLFWLPFSWRIIVWAPAEMGLFNGLLGSSISSIGFGSLYFIFLFFALLLYGLYCVIMKSRSGCIPFIFLKWTTYFVMVSGSIWMFIFSCWCSDSINSFYASETSLHEVFHCTTSSLLTGTLSLWFSALIFVTIVVLLVGLYAVEKEANFQRCQNWFQKEEQKSHESEDEVKTIDV